MMSQMKQSIGLVALVVREYDEALDFYVGTLGFSLVEDTYIPEQNKRWVVVAPPGAIESRLLLARAVGEEQSSRIGNQTGGRVFLFLNTDDFWRDYHAYKVSRLFASRKKRATAPLQSSRTCMETSGIFCNSGDDVTRPLTPESPQRASGLPLSA
jgi:hypothetical protein